MKPMQLKWILWLRDYCFLKPSGIERASATKSYATSPALPIGLCRGTRSRSLESAAFRRPSVPTGVGQTLLLFARQRSLEFGYGGRVGLHALQASEEFYRRNQMPEYEPDPHKEGLVYFEYAAFQR